ncbi:MAG: DNA starvation/stationary phase protection protein [Bacilli bacterium]|nr:DNA starvation/stationary phase protection protein [Bacilli bacterium]MDD4282993.1 DNA starvation/stationary phase protection protein [Bacilli bacterium]MDD4718807.1 DNA starvation/stationary phase protection protein [Bacilli bacterium]
MQDCYNKVGQIEILNEYLSNLKVLNNNLYNLHFNVIGEHFFTLHKKLDDYYNKVAEMYDAVAERIKMLNQYPITSLVEYEEKSTIKSMRSQDFTTKQVYSVLINDFSFMLAFSKELEEYSNSINDHITSSLMSDNINFFEKELWMLTASNK